MIDEKSPTVVYYRDFGDYPSAAHVQKPHVRVQCLQLIAKTRML
jgi:hypothetical protein